MEIVAGAEYVPARIADNHHFSQLTGRSPEWFERLTGIVARHRAAEGENANTMAVSAVRRLVEEPGVSLEGVDLVIGASCTPWDTVATIAHVIQRHFGLRGARAIYLSTACSSFINALELAAVYFETKRARRALIVVAEHMSLYSHDEDEQSGHLWGDAAVALLVSADPVGSNGLTVIDIDTVGLADVGAGPSAVYMTPRDEGLVMPNGKDVFNHACREMENAASGMLARHGLAVGRLRLLVPHQANQRIIDQVSRRMGLEPRQMACTIRELGNTGSVSVPITLLRCGEQLKAGDHSLLVTFGGGYSCGCALLQRR